MNAAYERGWHEGWSACLARVEDLGLEEVQRREKDLAAPGQLPLMVALDLSQRTRGGEHMETEQTQPDQGEQGTDAPPAEETTTTPGTEPDESTPEQGE